MWYIINKNNYEEVTTMRKELLKGLTEEQIKKVEACKDTSEILALAKAEGIELTDQQLEAVSGGGCFGTFKCKKCGSKDIKETVERVDTNRYSNSHTYCHTYRCRKCGYEWHTM